MTVNKNDEFVEANTTAIIDMQERVAEEVSQTLESVVSSSLVESLQAVKMAIDALYRVGNAIRQSSSSSINQRLSAFVEKNNDLTFENIVFLQLKYQFFDKNQKESNRRSPLSLYRQLAMSISYRYFGLLYWKHRQGIVERDREIGLGHPEETVSEKDIETFPLRKASQSLNNQDPNELRKLAMKNSGRKQKLQEPEGAPTTINSENVFKIYAESEKTFDAPRSVIITQGKEPQYPDPPKVDPITREAKCTFCWCQLFEKDLEKKNWWQ